MKFAFYQRLMTSQRSKNDPKKSRQKSIFLSWWILTVLFLCCFFRFFLVFFYFSWKFSFIFCMQFLSEQILSKKSYFNLENILFVAFYVANSNQHQHIVNNRKKKRNIYRCSWQLDRLISSCLMNFSSLCLVRSLVEHIIRNARAFCDETKEKQLTFDYYVTNALA